MGAKVIKAKGPFSLRLTALSHGFCQVPPFEWDEQKAVLRMAAAARNGKAVSLDIRQAAGGVKISSKNRRAPDFAAKAVAHCLRLDEDYTGFYELCAGEAWLESAAKSGAGRILRSPGVFEDIAKSICGTNVAWRQAVKMIHAICDLGDEVEGSTLRVFPPPEKILKAGPGWLRERARVGYRAEYIIDLCRRVAEGDLDVESVDEGKIKGDDLREFFLSVKGIGKSTAGYLLMLHGEYGHLAIDSAVHALMRRVTGRRMTDRQIEKRYERFGRWKALAMWYEWVTVSGWLEGF